MVMRRFAGILYFEALQHPRYGRTRLCHYVLYSCDLPVQLKEQQIPKQSCRCTIAAAGAFPFHSIDCWALELKCLVCKYKIRYWGLATVSAKSTERVAYVVSSEEQV
jgi:hypothetical protein